MYQSKSQGAKLGQSNIAAQFENVDWKREKVHYRCSSPMLPKATSTPSVGSAPGANNAKKKKVKEKEIPDSSPPPPFPRGRPAGCA